MCPNLSKKKNILCPTNEHVKTDLQSGEKMGGTWWECMPSLYVQTIALEPQSAHTKDHQTINAAKKTSDCKIQKKPQRWISIPWTSSRKHNGSAKRRHRNNCGMVVNKCIIDQWQCDAHPCNSNPAIIAIAALLSAIWRLYAAIFLNQLPTAKT